MLHASYSACVHSGNQDPNTADYETSNMVDLETIREGCEDTNMAEVCSILEADIRSEGIESKDSQQVILLEDYPSANSRSCMPRQKAVIDELAGLAASGEEHVATSHLIASTYNETGNHH
jgi:hypothetical protein